MTGGPTIILPVSRSTDAIKPLNDALFFFFFVRPLSWMGLEGYFFKILHAAGRAKLILAVGPLYTWLVAILPQALVAILPQGVLGTNIATILVPILPQDAPCGNFGTKHPVPLPRAHFPGSTTCAWTLRRTSSATRGRQLTEAWPLPHLRVGPSGPTRAAGGRT